MADQPATPHSRRALLAAAAGGAAALVTTALPASVAAHDPDDVQKGTANATTATTSIANTTTGSTAFKATATGAGVGVLASSSGAAGAYAFSVDDTGAKTLSETAYVGLYAWSPAGPPEHAGANAGVWGDSEMVGVLGTGSEGVVGVGVGGIGVRGTGTNGVLGQAEDAEGFGVRANGFSDSTLALQVEGKVHMSRSGKSTILAGRSSLIRTLAGVTTNSKVFAQLGSDRAGIYVRSVVTSTGSFTIRLNRAVSSNTRVCWWVLD